MAPGRPQQPRAWRQENDNGNRRISVASSEDVPVSGANVPFEELLARELRKSQGNEAQTATTNGKKSRKPFLKKGARGWWMQQPGAKRKVVKHTLTSKGDEQEATAKKPAQRRQQRKRSSSGSSSRTLSPVATPPEQAQTAPRPSRTLSPPASPIRRIRANNDRDHDGEVSGRRTQEEADAWKNASFRSTTSTDIMGMRNVRQSYEAKQEREANEMAEFEAIERDLAAEKEAYLKEKQPSPTRQAQVQDNQTDTNHWGLPYSSFVSELQEQEQSRWQTAPAGSIFDDSLDGEAESALVFDNQAALSKEDWMSDRNGLTSQLRDHFGYGDRFGELPSDLSAVSFDDSVPWDDGLSFQPRQSTGNDQSAYVGAAVDLPDTTERRYNSLGDGPSAATTRMQQAAKRGVYFAGHGDDETDEGSVSSAQDRVHAGNAPVSSLVQNVFGKCDAGSDNGSRYFDEDLDSAADSNSIDAPRRPPPVQDKSLSTLKQKLRGKQKPPVTRSSASTTGKRAGPTRTKAGTRPHTPAKQKPAGNQTQPADSGTILPAVIEEKLFELEEEVKFYKAETLQLQKRKDFYDQEVKKLAIERDEFARYEQEQRVQIEKEWERERAKMKKEEKLQERQWKLRLNATISHQDRKDRGEVEMLKAQIVKMQLEEKERAAKWKAGSESLRQRVAELEEKNRELSDEIKFLEKDRLEQWGKYERLLKEKQAPTRSESRSSLASAALPSEKSQLRTMDDLFSIKGTADELLQSWSVPRVGSPSHEEDNHEANHRRAQSSAVDGYNPKRYSLDREDGQPSSEPGAFANENNAGNTPVDGSVSDADQAHASSAAATYEWAFPAVEGGADRMSAQEGEADGAVSSSASSLSEHKTMSREIEHPGGKKEVIYTDGSRKITFPDGNEKDIDADGHVVIKFTNGDHKELFPATGISVYYYYEAQTKLTTFPDKRKVYEFPNQQVETSLPDGTTEIQFADGIKKTIRPNGDEFSVFPDGTTMLERPDGLREVTLLNLKKIRYFPDGQTACVAPGGQETRVRSDSELKRLME